MASHLFISSTCTLPTILHPVLFFFYSVVQVSITFSFCRAHATRLETKNTFRTRAPLAGWIRLLFICIYPFQSFYLICFLFVVRSLHFTLSVLLLAPMANLRDQNVAQKDLYIRAKWMYRVPACLLMSLFEDSLGTWSRWTWSSFCLEIRTLSCRFTFDLCSIGPATIYTDQLTLLSVGTGVGFVEDCHLLTIEPSNSYTH